MAEPFSTGADARTMILAGTGDEPIVRLATLRAKRQQRQNQAAENLRKLIHVGGGDFANPYTQELISIPGIREQRQEDIAAEHARKRELIELRSTRAKELQSMRGRAAPSAINKKVRELDGILNRGAKTLELAGKVAEKGDSFQSPGMDILGSILPSAAEQALRSATMSDEAKQVRMNMERVIAGIRKSELGSALTQYEARLGQNWNPLAPGISQADSIMRFEAMMDEMRTAREALAAGYDISGSSQYRQPPTSAARAPQRPEGVTDAEWQEYIWMHEQGLLE